MDANTAESIRQSCSIVIHGEQSAIVINEQLANGGPDLAWYPNLQLGRPELRVTLHSDSLANATGEAAAIRDWFVSMARSKAVGATTPDIALKVTPLREIGSFDWAKGTEVLNVSKQRHFAHNDYEQSKQANWDSTRRPDQPTAKIFDLRVHEWEDRHVFVTLDTDLINIGRVGRMADQLNKSFVIDPLLAQQYVDLYLKTHGLYRVMPSYTVNRGLYYWMRLWNIVPNFPGAWAYAVFGSAAPIGNEAIYEFMRALYARLMGMMQAHDRIGWLRYTPATNDTRDEMLNQLNYFMVLATGAFDSIAWLALHRFQIPFPKMDRQSITVRYRAVDTPQRRKPNTFFQNLEAQAPALAHFLKDDDNQSKIALFYKPRDAIQHRLVLTGAHLHTGQYLTDCNVVFLDDDAVEAIKAVDWHERDLLPFSVWGMMYPLEGEGRPILEPYRFTGEALRFMFSFVSDALEHLDLGGWLSTYPNIKTLADAAAQAGRQQLICHFAVPFP